jgi:hypothetical protein
MKSIVVFLFLVSCFFSNAQNQSVSDKVKDANRVRAYTFKEIDSIQLKFNEGLLDMKLSDDKEEEYVNVIVSYIAKMSRLNDLDMKYTKQEMSEKYYKYVGKLEKDVKSILTKKQYKEHIKNFGTIERSIEKRLLKKEN